MVFKQVGTGKTNDSIKKLCLEIIKTYIAVFTLQKNLNLLLAKRKLKCKRKSFNFKELAFKELLRK